MTRGRNASWPTSWKPVASSRYRPAGRSAEWFLHRLAEHFRPAERYPEAQVNDILRRYHQDFAMLRRLLVDEELMQRQAGMYWRAGTIPLRPAAVAAALAIHLAASPSRIDPHARRTDDVRA